MAKYFMLHKMASMRDEEEDLKLEEPSEELDEIGHIQIQEEQRTESTSEDSGSLPSNSSQVFNSSGLFSKSTEKCVKFAVSLLKFWCESNGEPTDVENMASRQLDRILGEFYSSVRTKTGTMYSVSSLISFRYSLNRYFQSLNGDKKIDIIESPNFANSNDVYNNVIKSLKLNVDDKNGVKQKNYLTPDDLRLIYTRVFNIESPKTLQFKVWLEVATYFTKCGRQKQRFLTRDSFVFGSDSVGRFVTLKKLPETNAQNLFQNLTREGRKMYEKKDHPMCPVLSLSRYLSKLNVNGNDLFQRPKYKVSHSNDSWYYHQPVGKNYLGNVMAMICKQAGITKHISNKCLKSITPQVLEACIFSIPCSKLFEPTCTIVSLNSPFAHQPTSTQVAENDHDVMLASNTTNPVTTDVNSNQMVSPTTSGSAFRSFHENQIKPVGSNDHSQDITSSGSNPSVSFEFAKQEIMKLFQSVDIQTSSDLKRWIINEDFAKEYRDDGQLLEGYRHEYDDRSMYARMMPHSTYPYNPGLLLKPGSYGPNVASRYPLSPLPIKPHTLSHYPNFGTPTQHIHNAGAAYGYNYHGMFLPPGNMLQSPTSTTHPVPSSSTTYHNPSTTQSSIYDNRSYQPDTTNYSTHGDINMSGDASLQSNKSAVSQGSVYEGVDMCTYNKCETWNSETVNSGCSNIIACDGKSTTDTNRHRSGKVCETSVKKKLAEKITGRKKRGRYSKKIMKTKFNDKSWDRSIIDEVFASPFSNTPKSNTVLSKSPTSKVSTPKKRSIPQLTRATPQRKKTRRVKIEPVTPEPNFQIVSVRSMSTRASSVSFRDRHAKDSSATSGERSAKPGSSRRKKSEDNVSNTKYKSEQAKSYFNYLGLDFKSKSPVDCPYSPSSSKSHSSSDKSGEAGQNYLSKSKNHSQLKSRLQLRKLEGKRSKERFGSGELSKQRLAASPDCTRCDELKQRFGVVPMLYCCHSGKYKKTSDSLKNGSSVYVQNTDSSIMKEKFSEGKQKSSSQNQFSSHISAVTEENKDNCSTTQPALDSKKGGLENKSYPEHPSVMSRSEHPPEGSEHQSAMAKTNRTSALRRKSTERIVHPKSMTNLSSLSEPTSSKKLKAQKSPPRLINEKTLIRKECLNGEPYIKSLHFTSSPKTSYKYGKRSSTDSSVTNQKDCTKSRCVVLSKKPSSFEKRSKNVNNQENVNANSTSTAKEVFPKHLKSLSQIRPLKHFTSPKKQPQPILRRSLRKELPTTSDSSPEDSKISKQKEIQEPRSVATPFDNQSLEKTVCLIPDEKPKEIRGTNQKENNVIVGDKIYDSGVKVIARRHNPIVLDKCKDKVLAENNLEYDQDSMKAKALQNTLSITNQYENINEEAPFQNNPDPKIVQKAKQRQKFKTFKKRQSDKKIQTIKNDMNNCVVVNPIYKGLVNPMKPWKQSRILRNNNVESSGNMAPSNTKDVLLSKVNIPPQRTSLVSSQISCHGDGPAVAPKLLSKNKTENTHELGAKNSHPYAEKKQSRNKIQLSNIKRKSKPDDLSKTNDSLKSKSLSSISVDSLSLANLQRFLEVNLQDILKNAAQSIGKGHTVANSSGIPVNISLGNPKEFSTASHLKSTNKNEKSLSFESLDNSLKGIQLTTISGVSNSKGIQSTSSGVANTNGIQSTSSGADIAKGIQSISNGVAKTKGIQFTSSGDAKTKGIPSTSSGVNNSKGIQTTSSEVVDSKGIQFTSNVVANTKGKQYTSSDVANTKGKQYTSSDVANTKGIQTTSSEVANSRENNHKDKTMNAGLKCSLQISTKNIGSKGMVPYKNVSENDESSVEKTFLPKNNHQDKETESQTRLMQKPKTTVALNPSEIQKQNSKNGFCNVSAQHKNNIPTNLVTHPLIAKKPLKSSNVTQFVSNPALISSPMVLNTSSRFNPLIIKAWQKMINRRPITLSKNGNLENANNTSSSTVSRINQLEIGINTELKDSLINKTDKQIKDSVSNSNMDSSLHENSPKNPSVISQPTDETKKGFVVSSQQLLKTMKRPVNMLKLSNLLKKVDSKTELQQNDLPCVSRKKTTKSEIPCSFSNTGNIPQQQSQIESFAPVTFQQQPRLDKEESLPPQSHKKTIDSVTFQQISHVETTNSVALQLLSREEKNNPVTLHPQSKTEKNDSLTLQKQYNEDTTDPETSHIDIPANIGLHQQFHTETTYHESFFPAPVTHKALSDIETTSSETFHQQSQRETNNPITVQPQSQKEKTNSTTAHSQFLTKTFLATSNDGSVLPLSSGDKPISDQTSTNTAVTPGAIPKPFLSKINHSPDSTRLLAVKHKDDSPNNSSEFCEISPRKSKASTNLFENFNIELTACQDGESEDKNSKKQSPTPSPVITEFVKFTGPTSEKSKILPSFESDLNKESCICVYDMISQIAARREMRKPSIKEEQDSPRLSVSTEDGQNKERSSNEDSKGTGHPSYKISTEVYFPSSTTPQHSAEKTSWENQNAGPSVDDHDSSFDVPDSSVNDFDDLYPSVDDPDSSGIVSAQEDLKKESTEEKPNTIRPFVSDPAANFVIKPWLPEHEKESTQEQTPTRPFLDDDLANFAIKPWLAEHEKEIENVKELDERDRSHHSTSASQDSKDQKKKKPMLLKVKFSEFNKRFNKKKTNGHKVTSPSRQSKE